MIIPFAVILGLSRWSSATKVAPVKDHERDGNLPVVQPTRVIEACRSLEQEDINGKNHVAFFL